MEKEDWRLRGQEEYMLGMKFKYTKFEEDGSEEGAHEHCEFCWHKFMAKPFGVNDCSSEGYCSENKKHWVCKTCFEDFGQDFCWQVIE